MKDLKVAMKFALVVVLWVLVSIVESVKITKFHVPSMVYHNTEATLECDFTLDEKDDDLVVKWYLNDAIVYQWIVSATDTRPQSLGLLKNKVKMDHHPHKIDEKCNCFHRLLHITKLGPDLSGNFTCSVSTLQSEDMQTKPMLVVVTENSFELKRLNADEGYIRVQCRADGIFPQPVMTLHSEKRDIEAPILNYKQVGHLYEISAQVTLLELEEPEEYSCKLNIPVANYTTRKATVFYPGAASNVSTSKWLTAIGLLLSFLTSLQYSNLR